MGDYVDDTSLITSLDVVPLDQLHRFHRNPRKGSIPAIRASLDQNRQYKPIVVNRGGLTGRPNEVLAGNHTVDAAQELGWQTLAVVWVDVDDEQATRINLADNRVPELGEYDDRLLLELLETLPDLDGTGFDPGDLDDLAAALEEQDPGTGADQDEDEDIFGRGERYAGKGSRQINLSYDLGTFEWIVGKLGELADRYGVESHADVVLKLVVAETGSEPDLGAEHPAWRDAPAASDVQADADSAEAPA